MPLGGGVAPHTVKAEARFISDKRHSQTQTILCSDLLEFKLRSRSMDETPQLDELESRHLARLTLKEASLWRKSSHAMV